MIKEQRYQCRICDQTFFATKGTPLYRLHKALDLFVVVLTLLSHGCPPQAIVACRLLGAFEIVLCLQDALYAAYERINSAETVEETAQASLSCRRVLAGLADVLFPPGKEPIDGHPVDKPRYKNRLMAYVAECLSGQARDGAAQQVEELKHRIEGVDKLANKGLHDEVGLVDARTLFFELSILAYDLLRLQQPPHELPALRFRVVGFAEADYSREEELRRLLEIV